MEEEVIDLLKSQPYVSLKDLSIQTDRGVTVRYKCPHMRSSIDRAAQKEHPTEILFDHDEEGVMYAEKLGINTNRFIGLTDTHSDEQTREQYIRFLELNEWASFTTKTRYYFTQDGEYKKASTMHLKGLSRTDPNRKVLGTNGTYITYESEMTPGDFEIAGQALQMLINRLKPQEQPEMDSGSSPE